MKISSFKLNNLVLTLRTVASQSRHLFYMVIKKSFKLVNSFIIWFEISLLGAATSEIFIVYILFAYFQHYGIKLTNREL